MKLLLFFTTLIFNIFLVLYFIYSYFELYFFNHKQGAKLNIKNKERN